MSQHTMADPQALGIQHQLGNLKATYKPSLFFPIGITLLCLGVSWWMGFGFTFITLALLGTLLYLGIVAYRIRRRCVFVYEHGLIHVGRKSLQTIIPWRDVREVLHTVSFGANDPENTFPYHHYTIIRMGGTSHTLSYPLRNIKHLGESIKMETARYRSQQGELKL